MQTVHVLSINKKKSFLDTNVNVNDMVKQLKKKKAPSATVSGA